MIDKLTALEQQRKDVEWDFASFADTGTDVDVSRDGHTFRVKWVTRGKQQESTFSALTMDAYRALIAGPQLADLRTVADMIHRTFQPEESESFIATRAKYENPTADPRPAIELLTELIESPVGEATRVTMLTGAAGAGKTKVLKELVRQQADKYLHGQTKKLLLYVNAQGRALARLNEALATELQDLRVGLTYHSVAVLARLGILVPVIDGFDELLGVSGYDDAFSSLAALLEQLKGQGQLLTSARSVYYEKEFLDRAPRVNAEISQAWDHVPIRLIEWDENDREMYIVNWFQENNISGQGREHIRKHIGEIFSGENEYFISKPLFFTRSLDLAIRDPDFSFGDDPLRGLSNEYLNRELREKLLDRNSRPLLTEKQFHRLMCELAEEMWNQDTRELDYNSIGIVAEYVAEDEGLSETARRTVKERVPTLAFLGRGGGLGTHTGAFEHEVFFFYFLGRLIASRLSSDGGDIGLLLSRSALPEEVAERVAREVRGMEDAASTQLQKLVDRLVKAAKTEWLRMSQVRQNAGLLVMALFRRIGDVKNCFVESLEFPGSNLEKVSLTECSFTDVTVWRTDLTSTKFLDCDVSDTVFVEPKISCDITRLELRGIALENFSGICEQDDTIIYQPSIIAKKLIQCGATIYTESISRGEWNISGAYINVLEKLMRAYSRANPVYRGDDTLTGIFCDPAWDTLEKLLIEHRLIKSQLRQTSGLRKEFFRRQFSPREFMAGVNRNTNVDQRIREFWQALEKHSTMRIQVDS